MAAVKVTPAGRFGLGTLVRPWTGRVSTTLTIRASWVPCSRPPSCRCPTLPAVIEETPSVFVMPRVAWALRLSVSVAVTVEASAAVAVAEFTYVLPVAPEGTVRRASP